MEKQIGKHTRLICDINIGDTVRMNGFNLKLDNKDFIVEDIITSNSPSGFMVKTSGYHNYVDADWLTVFQTKLPI